VGVDDTSVHADRMSDIDAVVWGLDADPRLHAPIGSVSYFASPLDPERVTARLDRASRAVPRLRQRAVPSRLGLSVPRWEIDPTFSIERHVDVAEGTATRAEVLERTSDELARPFDRDQPLWSTVIYPDLGDGTAAMISRGHHALTDGLGALRIQLEMFDLEADPQPSADEPPAPDTSPPSRQARMVSAIEHELANQTRFLHGAARFLGTSIADPAGARDEMVDAVGSALRLAGPVGEALSPLLTQRSSLPTVRTLTLDLEIMKATASAAGVTLNDVFVSGTCAGMQILHERAGLPTERLRMAMPISTRGPDDDVETNRFVPLRFEIPLGAESTAAHFEIVHALVTAARREPAIGLVEPAAGIASRLPRAALLPLFRRMVDGTDFVASNLPGSPLPVWFCGSRLVAQYPFGPLTGAAVNVSLLSYCDDVAVGVVADTGAVDDPDELVECLRLGYARALGACDD
jgi:WS/DGAT/MGAT family acyltransferase